MRGGIINKQRLKVFVQLIVILRKFNIISYEEYVVLYDRVDEINPLIKSNQFFIDKFEN